MTRTCTQCKNDIDETIEYCPHCGAKFVVLTDGFRMFDFEKTRGKRPGAKRPILNSQSGIRPDERRPGKFVKESRSIRRDVPGGQYDHRLEKLDEKGNPTGEPIHEEHETLKEHNEKKRKK